MGQTVPPMMRMAGEAIKIRDKALNKECGPCLPSGPADRELTYEELYRKALWELDQEFPTEGPQDMRYWSRIYDENYTEPQQPEARIPTQKELDHLMEVTNKQMDHELKLIGVKPVSKEDNPGIVHLPM